MFDWLQDDLKYYIKTDQLGDLASKFFHLDADSAIMRVRRPLNRTDPESPANSVFVFAITVEDQVPVNSKTGEASVSITVTSGDRPPKFDLSVYRSSITENDVINSTVVRTRAVDPDGNGQV